MKTGNISAPLTAGHAVAQLVILLSLSNMFSTNHSKQYTVKKPCLFVFKLLLYERKINVKCIVLGPLFYECSVAAIADNEL